MPSRWQTASDVAGRVQVNVHATGLDVQVTVLPGWRRLDGVESLGAAVLAAYAAAASARLTEQASEQLVITLAAEPGQRSLEWATAPQALLHRAFRDLDEFRLQLKDLRTAGMTVTDPSKAVTVTLQGTQIVAVDADPYWLSSAQHVEVGQRLAMALTAAARAGRARLERALEGCPDLMAVLAGASSVSAPLWGLN